LEGCHRQIKSTVDAIEFRGEISERRESIKLRKEGKGEMAKGLSKIREIAKVKLRSDIGLERADLEEVTSV